MKPKTAIFLLAVLLLCVGYVAVRHAGWFTSEDEKSDGEGKPVAKRLFEPAPGAPTKLTIATGEDGKIVFTKIGEDWRIVEPISAKAESFEVTKVTDALAGLKGTKVADSPASATS